MNANGLARLCDRLAVLERIPLLDCRPSRRGNAEYRQLFDASAPRTWYFSKSRSNPSTCAGLRNRRLPPTAYSLATYEFVASRRTSSAGGSRRITSSSSLPPEAMCVPIPFTLALIQIPLGRKM